jgi:hypothetical protein
MPRCGSVCRWLCPVGVARLVTARGASSVSRTRSRAERRGTPRAERDPPPLRAATSTSAIVVRGQESARPPGPTKLPSDARVWLVSPITFILCFLGDGIATRRPQTVCFLKKNPTAQPPMPQNMKRPGPSFHDLGSLGQKVVCSPHQDRPCDSYTPNQPRRLSNDRPRARRVALGRGPISAW